ncbi:MAG: STAS domain-containing protein [Planctomycetota bacterium]
MKVTHEDYDQMSVVSLRGEFVGEDNAEMFRAEVKQRLAGPVRDVIVDLESVEFVDSRAFETLLWLQDACAEKLGQVRLAAAQESVEEALRLTRLVGRFDCHEDIDAAIRSLR